jgi:hypothetical protein
MLQQVVSTFVNSPEAKVLAASFADLGLSPEQGTAAVAATAEGAQHAVGDAGLGGLLALVSDGHGPLSRLGELLGVGSVAPSGLSGPMVDQIAASVADRVGLSSSIAQRVVGRVLPRLIEAAQDVDDGGLLGGLLG